MKTRKICRPLEIYIKCSYDFFLSVLIKMYSMCGFIRHGKSSQNPSNNVVLFKFRSIFYSNTQGYIVESPADYRVSAAS